MIYDGYWMYTVNPESDEPIMLIDNFLGFDEEQGYGIMGDLFQKELLQLDTMEKSRIQIWINSPGGDIDDGYNIYNAMLKTKTKVDTYCYGMAASMAAVIFQAGRKRVMADYAWLMYHNPSGSDNSDLMDTFTESIAKMISTRTGKTEDEIKAIMKKETYIMADEAKANGLCDEVEKSAEQNKKRAMPQDVTAFWKEASKIINSILPTKNLNKDNMKKVANKLNLNAEASEEAIVAEIESVQNKVTTAQSTIAEHVKTIQNKETEIGKLKEEVAAKEKELQDVKNQLAEKESEFNKKEQEATAKAAAEEAAKAKNMIEGFAQAGVIKNDEAVKNEWIESCKTEGIEKVKNKLESLPLNRKAVKIGDDIQNKSEQVKYSFAGAMVNIANKQK